MKMSIASVAVALVYLVSLTTADHLKAMGATMTSDLNGDNGMTSDQATTTDQDMGMTSGPRGAPSLVVPVGVVTTKIDAKNNNIFVTKSNILLSKSDRVQLAHTIESMVANNPEAGPASAMTTEDLIGLLSSIATNPGVLSNAAGIISAARSGNTGALAGHVVGLLGAALPAATPAAPVVAPTAAPLPAPVIAPVSTPVVASIATPAIPAGRAAAVPTTSA